MISLIRYVDNLPRGDQAALACLVLSIVLTFLAPTCMRATWPNSWGWEATAVVGPSSVLAVIAFVVGKNANIRRLSIVVVPPTLVLLTWMILSAGEFL
jgi:hypothetical protein